MAESTIKEAILIMVCWLLACLTSQQHASVPQRRICSDNFTCCHTGIEAADQNLYLTQSQYTDIGPTSPSTDPTTPGAWQVATGVPFLSHWYDSTPKKSRDSNPVSSALETDALTIRPKRRSLMMENVDTLVDRYYLCDPLSAVDHHAVSTTVGVECQNWLHSQVHSTRSKTLQTHL